MDMKEHIIAALREQFGRWEELLAELDEEQITAPQFDDGWSLKDVMAHLWGWQQISLARMEAGALRREPRFPEWVAKLGEDWEDNADQSNAHLFQMNHGKSWPEIQQDWRLGFLRLLELADQISERELLDADRYGWLNGYNLAFILVASYDHHQEHLEKVMERLQRNSNTE